MDSKKGIFPVYIILLGFIFLFVPFFAQGALSFGIKNPGLLPTSPLYFLKEWRRDFVRMFVTDSLSQVRFELRIVDEKAAELKKVLELKSVDEIIIRQTLKSYGDSIGKFTSKLKEAEFGSGGSKLSVFLEELFGKAIEHERFLTSVSRKYNNDGKIHDLVIYTQDEISKAGVVVSEEMPRDILESAIKKSFDDKILDMEKEIGPHMVEKIAEIVPEYAAKPPVEMSSAAATSSDATSTIPITESIRAERNLSQ